MKPLALPVVAALITSALTAIVFQSLSDRPNAEPLPNLAVTLVSAATLCLWLSPARRAAVLVLLAGVAISLLGRVSVTAALGGALVGAGFGAASHGLFAFDRPRWPWLLWPQIALMVLISEMAYLNRLPVQWLDWPYADKVIHALLFGLATFWLNLWLQGRRVMHALPLAIAVPFVIAAFEEMAQGLSPHRSPDLADLLSNLIGMLMLYFVSERLRRSSIKKAYVPIQLSQYQ